MVGHNPIRRSPFAPSVPVLRLAKANVFARQEARTHQDRPLLNAGWRIDR